MSETVAQNEVGANGHAGNGKDVTKAVTAAGESDHQPPHNGHQPAVESSPPAKRRGAPIGNENAVGSGLSRLENHNGAKHFVYSRLKLSALPRKFMNVSRAVNDFRATVETVCRETHGEISLIQGATINTACWNERLLRVWAKRLADSYETMDHVAVAAATDRIAKHAAARDAALKLLDLDRDAQSSIWATLDQPALPLTKSAAVDSADHEVENVDPGESGSDPRAIDH